MTKKKRKYKEKDLQKRFFYEYFRKHEKIFMNCFYFPKNEMDIASFTGKLLWEIEVKVSYSDFLADKNKEKKHEMLKKAFSSKKDIKNLQIPNKFWYFAPEDIIKEDEIPEYAGFMVLTKDNKIVCFKQAPILHKNKLLPEKLLNHVYYKSYLPYLKYKLK